MLNRTVVDRDANVLPREPITPIFAIESKDGNLASFVTSNAV
jgi:hypothetical protein